MNTYLLLVGISNIPALISALFTLPLWFVKKISNQTIFVCGLIVLTITHFGILIFACGIDSPGIGLSSILISCINLFLFRHYLRILYTTRCPVCRNITLHIHKHNRNIYRLYCRKCGQNTEWWE